MRNPGHRARAAVALVATSLLVIACGGTTTSQAPSTPAAATGPAGTAAATAAARTIDDVCADAAGTTVTFLSRSEVVDEEIINAKFHETYPDIAVTHITEASEDATARLLTEIQAGRVPEGTIVSGNFGAALPLFEAGYVADYDLIGLGFPENLVVEARDVQVVRSHRSFGGLMYNSDETDPADLPNTWKELATATQLKGQYMSDPRGIFLGALRLVWTQEEYEAFIATLLTNVDPVLVRGTSGSIAKILTGEFVTGDQGRSQEVEQQAAEGAPIALKHLADVVPTSDNFATIVEGPNTDAAVCYAHWTATSPEGLDILFEVTKKRNVDLPPAGLPEGAVLATIEDEEDVNLFSEAARFAADALEGQTTVE